jgi:bifunctional DNA-binding transcriptional regulator/antitoxin component of YhaV-PrlF toxin-antitoxin module
LSEDSIFINDVSSENNFLFPVPLPITISQLSILEKLLFRNNADILPLQYFSKGRHTAKEIEMNLTIQVRERGVVTLPAELREKYHIENGKIFHLVDMDGIFVFVPMMPMAPELANEIERIRLEAGLSVEDLLDGLRKQRERYNQEKYGQSI